MVSAVKISLERGCEVGGSVIYKYYEWEDIFLL